MQIGRTIKLPAEGPDAWLFHLAEALIDEFYGCENITAAFAALPQVVCHMAIDIELRQGDAAVTAFLDQVQAAVAQARANHEKVINAERNAGEGAGAHLE